VTPPSPRTARLSMILELFSVLTDASLMLSLAPVSMPCVARSIEIRELGVREWTLQLIL
jgi:hypothetical protein